MGGARKLVLVGLVVWAVSWFVSPHAFISALKMGDKVADQLGAAAGSGKVESKGDAMPSGPSGWIAFRMTWEMTFEGSKSKDGSGSSEKDGPFGGSKGDMDKSLSATCLTNFLMLLAILAFLARWGGGGAKVVGVLLLAAAAYNAGWLYRTDGEFRSGLEAGYWMWLGSFVLAGVGFLRADRDSPP